MTLNSTARSRRQRRCARARIGHGHRPTEAFGDGKWRNENTRPDGIAAAQMLFGKVVSGRPRQDSNLRTRLRRPLLYPLSYGGSRAEKRVSARDGAVDQRAGAAPG